MAAPQLVQKPFLLYQHLSTNGDGTGVISAIGDYRDAPTGDGLTAFFIQPPEGEIYYLYRLLVFIEDVGTIKGALYGAMAALPNGVEVQVTHADDSPIQISHPDINIKANHEWGRICYDVTERDYGPTESNYVLVRWTFFKAGEALELRDQQKLKLLLNDDFTGLIDHTFHVQGINASRKQDGTLRKGQGLLG